MIAVFSFFCISHLTSIRWVPFAIVLKKLDDARYNAMWLWEKYEINSISLVVSMMLLLSSVFWLMWRMRRVSWQRSVVEKGKNCYEQSDLRISKWQFESWRRCDEATKSARWKILEWKNVSTFRAFFTWKLPLQLTQNVTVQLWIGVLIWFLLYLTFAVNFCQHRHDPWDNIAIPADAKTSQFLSPFLLFFFSY